MAILINWLCSVVLLILIQENELRQRRFTEYEYPKVYRIMSKPNNIPVQENKNPTSCVSKIIIPYDYHKINELDPENNGRFQSLPLKPNYFVKYVNDYIRNKNEEEQSNINHERKFPPRAVSWDRGTKYPQNNYITTQSPQTMIKALVRPYRSNIQNMKPIINPITSEDNYYKNKESPLIFKDVIRGSRRFNDDPDDFDESETNIYAWVRPYKSDITNIKPITYEYYIPKKYIFHEDDLSENNNINELSSTLNDLTGDNKMFYNYGDEYDPYRRRSYDNVYYFGPGIKSYGPRNNFRNVRRRTNTNPGTTHILTLPSGKQFSEYGPVTVEHEEILSSILMNLKETGVYIDDLSQTLLLHFVYFLKLLEVHDLMKSNITPELMGLFKHNSDLRDLIKIIYSSRFFNLHPSQSGLDNVQNFINYSVKLKDGYAKMSDLTPELVIIIKELKYWLEFLPPLPPGVTAQIILHLIKFINDAAALILDLQNIPKILLEYFQNVPVVVYESAVSILAINKPNINPDIILQLIEYLKNRQLGNISAELQLFLDKLNPSSTTQGNILLELKLLILNIVNNKKLDISPSLLEIIIKLPDVQKHIETIFRTENIPKSDINPEIIIQLLQLVKDSQNNSPIKIITKPLIDLILKLKGINNLEISVLEMIHDRYPSELESALLQLMLKHGDKEIPPHIKKWLSTLSNGQALIDFLLQPGDIDCSQDVNNKVTCTKIRKDDVPNSVQIELENFIKSIINSKRMNDLSSNLLEFIIKHPDMFINIQDIFQKENILNSEVNPQIINQLLHLLKDSQMNMPTKNIPESLVDLILKLTGVNNNLETSLLESINDQKLSDLKSVLLLFMLKHGGKEIPSHIKEWILTLPKGQELIDFLEKPGAIECSPVIDSKVECTKKLKDDDVPNSIQIELENFIKNIIDNDIMNDISSNLLDFHLIHPDMHKYIKVIFGKEHFKNSKINPETIIQLLQLLKDSQLNNPTENISESLINLILKLKGVNNNLEKAVVENINDRNPSDLKSVLLQLMLKYGGKEIPGHIKKWLLTLTNGPELVDFLEKPGDIDCSQVINSKVKCSKKIKNDAPQSIQIELENFIKSIINDNIMNNISQNLLEFLLKEPNIDKHIEIIFQKENIKNSDINPETIIQLLDLLKDSQMNTPIKNIPESLIPVILELNGVNNNLEKSVVENINEHNPSDLKSVLLKLMLKYGGKDIPTHIKYWLATLPNGEELADFLVKPGDIDCNQVFGKVRCTKKIKDDAPQNIRIELENFIKSIIDYKKMNDISPTLLEFIIEHPDVHKYIQAIFQTENIPSSEINSELITQLLKLLKDSQTNTPIKNISEQLIGFTLSLNGVNSNLENSVLEYINEHYPSYLESILLHLMFKNGGKEPPPHIKKWILTLPDGQEFIKLLEHPNDVECSKDINNKLKCTKQIKDEVPPNVETELEKLIEGIINNKELYDVSPYLFEFLIKHHDLQNIVESIFQKEKILNSKITPKILIDLLHLIISNKNKEPIKEISDELQELVLSLKKNEELLKILLEWTKINKPADMMQIFLQMIKENGGKIIPQFLREWILLLPNGKQIIDNLQLPGEIECNRKPGGNVLCIKTLISTTPSQGTGDHESGDAAEELKNFIYEINNNNKLSDISSTLLESILKTSDLEKLVFEIFQKNGIPTLNINSHMITQLLQLLIKIKNNESITEVPSSVLALVSKLTNTENLSKILLNWISINKQPDMLQIFLQIIKENGGTIIPPNLRMWLLSLANGEKILEYLQLPGTIECTEKANDHVQCIKTLTEK